MEDIKLNVTQGVYKTAKEARNAGRIPIIYYGKSVEKPINFSIDYQEFRRAYNKGGKSVIMTLVNEKKENFPVLVHEIQYDPVSDNIIHVDMMAVELGKIITTEVPLVFTGQSLAIKELNGIFVKSKEKVLVECLPRDLIHEIEVDITVLEDFNSVISVGDLKVPETITILDAPDINIATVSAPRVEEEPVVAEPAEGEEDEETSAEGEEEKEGEASKEDEPKKEEGGKA